MVFCRWACEAGYHAGKVFAVGRVVSNGKRNKPEEYIAGIWKIRKCRRCGSNFSNINDAITGEP